MSTPALQLHDVSVRFGGLTAVSSISLAVPAGERLAVIGPNGAGKTTLFRVISGEQRATGGRVELSGRDVTRLGPHRRARLGLGRTYQVTSLFPALTVRENLAMALLAGRRDRHRFWSPLRWTGGVGAAVDGWLERIGLAARRTDAVGVLSHGEQRQLELGLALAGEPSVLLLDEPAAGLSGSERPRLVSLIEDLTAELTIILIEHDIDMAFGFADRVLCLDNGEVVSLGTPAAVRADDRVQAVYLGAR